MIVLGLLALCVSAFAQPAVTDATIDIDVAEWSVLTFTSPTPDFAFAFNGSETDGAAYKTDFEPFTANANYKFDVTGEISGPAVPASLTITHQVDGGFLAPVGSGAVSVMANNPAGTAVNRLVWVAVAYDRSKGEGKQEWDGTYTISIAKSP